MLETKSAGGVVINSDGEILVVSQHGTSWSLPKGHVEMGENLRASAEREIHEEAGITDIRYIRELGTYQRYKIGKAGQEDQSEFKTITMFLFKVGQSELKPIDPENPEARWVERESCWTFNSSKR